ncbi:MAG TPA: response regulator [Mucilaginibacter sp.]|jgi:DNA-binding response OmpR family regulator|nr:response regulator [Mucilaginibacter sp.]
MKKVLLLDNDEDVLDVMQEALSYEGFEVKCIGQTNDIFPEIERYRPDVVILDYILDGVNGGEICHQIKENKKTSDMPVILVSAYPKVLWSLGDYGCDDFIPKPFDLDDFTGRILKLIDCKKKNNYLHAE